MYTISASHHQLPRLLQVIGSLSASCKHRKLHARQHDNLDGCCLADEGCPGHILLAALSLSSPEVYVDLCTAKRQGVKRRSCAAKGVLVADDKYENSDLNRAPQCLIKP